MHQASNSLAMRRDEHDRHNRKVARIQYGSDRLLWASNVLVRSLTALERSRRRPYSATVATGHHWDGRWRTSSPAPASRDSHSPHGDKNAWRCQSHEGVDGSAAWE